MKKHVLCSSLISRACLSSLKGYGYEPILLPEYNRLQKGVATHPDMLVFIYKDTFLCTGEYYPTAENELDKLTRLGYSPLLCDVIPSKDYPNDILFNVLHMGDYIFGLTPHISREIREIAKRDGVTLVNVKQGYTKCSSVKVSDTALITADRTITNAALSCGIDVLRISPAHVRLDGYDTGFIGGASGADDDAVYFCGDVSHHPDADAIKAFCQKHGKECVSLSDEELTDVGTLFFI